MISKLGGRKFVIAVVGIISAVAVDTLSKKGLSEGLINTLIGIVALFVTGNHLEYREQRKTNQQSDVKNIITQTGEITDSLPVYETIPYTDPELHRKVDEIAQVVLSTAQIQEAFVNKAIKHLPKD